MPAKRAAVKDTETERPTTKRAKSSTKRKSSPADGSDSDSKPSTSKKKAKTAADTAGGDGVSANGQPNNKVLPVNITFAPKNEGTLRIAAWNICGLAAASKKVRLQVAGIWPSVADFSRHEQGFKYYVEAEDADILVLTETKVCTIISGTYVGHGRLD